MRKGSIKTILILLSTVLAFGLLACSDDKSRNGNGSGEDPTAEQSITRINIFTSSTTIGYGESMQLTAIATLSDNVTRDVTSNVSWSSSDPCAHVDSNGLLTADAAAPGMATITARYGQFSGKLQIAVKALSEIVESVAVQPQNSVIELGSEQQYSATATYRDATTQDVTSIVTWGSSEVDVAVIDANGRANGKKKGTTTITAEMDGVVSDGILLTVLSAVKHIDIAPKNASIQRDGIQQYEAKAILSNGDSIDVTGAVTWVSSDPSIVAFAAGGLAMAGSDKSGTVRISAELDGVTSDATSLTVTVAEREIESLEITADATTIAADETIQISAIATYSDASTVDVTDSVGYICNNTNAAKINASGLLTGVNEGSAKISAFLKGITSNKIRIAVENPLRRIDIMPNQASLTLSGEPPEVQFSAHGTYANGDTADLRSKTVWVVSDTSVASIDNNGLASAVAEGTTTIFAEFDGITSDSATLAVGSSPDPIEVKISPMDAKIDADETKQFKAFVKYSDGSKVDMTESVTWRSTNIDAASIDASGLASGNSDGKSSITAQYAGLTSKSAKLKVKNPLRTIDISPNDATIDADANQQYTAEGTYANGEMTDLTGNVTWSSSDPETAAIGTNGLCSGINDGSTTVTASMNGIISDAATLTVEDPLRTIDISPDSTAIHGSETAQYTAIGVHASGDIADLTALAIWTSSDTHIADIDSSGLATSQMAHGETNIQASYGDIESDIATLTVLFEVKTLVAIDISPDDAAIDADGTQQYMATGTYEDSSTADITGSVVWSSSTPDVATIDSRGMAISVGSGSTDITAALDAITSNIAVLNVGDSLRSIDITPHNAAIDADGSQQYTATGTYASGNTADLTSSVSWNSSNPNAAVLDDSGMASAVNNGVTMITASIDGVTSNTATLTVDDPLVTIAISTETGTIDLSVNPVTAQFSAIGTYASGETAVITANVTWNSDNTGIAAINEGGLATGVNNGTVNITASLGGITSDSVALTVVDPPVGLDISPDTISVVRGSTRQYFAEVSYASGDTADVTSAVDWSSSDTSVVTVDDGGRAMANETGSSAITAVYTEGAATVSSDTATITVTNTIVAIDIAPDSAAIDGGATQQYSATAVYEDDSTGDITGSVTWHSDNTAIATIDTSGLATGVTGSGGTTHITAVLDGLTSDTAELTVNAGISPPVITNVDLFRGTVSTNTEMELWSDAYGSGGVVIAYDPGITNYYAYIAGFADVTLNIDATDAETLTVNGTAISASADHTVTLDAKGENTLAIHAQNSAGSAACTIIINFLDFNHAVNGLFADYFNATNIKWFTINAEVQNLDELTISGNISGEMYWRISNNYTIDCNDVVADEADIHFGGSGADFCGDSGLFGAFNRMSFTTPYNDGNDVYNGTQDGNAWSADWHVPANEGGMTIRGDSVSRLEATLNGSLRSRFSCYLDGRLILIAYQHFALEGGLVAEGSESYTDFIYMPEISEPDGIDSCAEAGGAWCEEGRVFVDSNPTSPW